MKLQDFYQFRDFEVYVDDNDLTVVIGERPNHESKTLINGVNMINWDEIERDYAQRKECFATYMEAEEECIGDELHWLIKKHWDDLVIVEP